MARAIWLVTRLLWAGRSVLEDGVGIKALRTAYVLGALTASVGLLPLAAAVNRAGYRRLAGVTVVLSFGVVAVVAGGGFIVLAALAALAAAPVWFAQRSQVLRVPNMSTL